MNKAVISFLLIGALSLTTPGHTDTAPAPTAEAPLPPAKEAPPEQPIGTVSAENPHAKKRSNMANIAIAATAVIFAIIAMVIVANHSGKNKH